MRDLVQSRLRKAHECYLMSHSMYLAVWVMLYGSDVEEAETTMSIDTCYKTLKIL